MTLLILFAGSDTGVIQLSATDKNVLYVKQKNNAVFIEQQDNIMFVKREDEELIHEQ